MVVVVVVAVAVVVVVEVGEEEEGAMGGQGMSVEELCMPVSLFIGL